MSHTIRASWLLIGLAVVCGRTLAFEVDQQIVVAVEEATLHAGAEEVGKLSEGTTLTVLEASDDGWLRIETDISAWIRADDVASAGQLRGKFAKQIDDDEPFDALETVTLLLKLDKERTWQDYRSRAELISDIVLQEKYMTKEKMPFGVDGMQVVMSDWQEAQKLGANEGLARRETIQALLSRADLHGRLAAALGGVFEPPALCQLARGQAVAGERDVATARQHLQKAIADYVEIERLIKLETGILTFTDKRKRAQRVGQFHQQLGDTLLIDKNLDEASGAYETAIKTIDDNKAYLKAEDIYSRMLFGRALVSQQRGEDAAELFADAVDSADFATPGLGKELKHWANPAAKPRPSSVAVGPDGKPLTLIEEVIVLAAEVKGLKPEQIKPDSKLTDLNIDDLDLFEILEQLEERHRVAVPLNETQRATGLKILDPGPLRGTISTIADLVKRAKESANQ